ncbi:unnamed protein product [Phytophthora fragariaefolia]|uniref:Unnamed protein product n=1 Tax=Phytophthora fragariaefolia TaxID=1490495 RepID=A0A9W7CPM4_9STRA|nr:unnamed protein product [Phytophthora fragariaefolia]
MADHGGNSRRSSRQGPRRPKTPQRNVTEKNKPKSTLSRNRGRQTPRDRNVIKAQSGVTSLPSDLWTLLLPFLTWRDTSAMRCVCSEWRQVLTEAKTLSPEWRATILGPSANGADSLELLRTNHLKWADTRFAPDLVLLSAASRDPCPWHSGGYWEEAIAGIEEAKLVPPTCKIICVLTMNAVLGREDEEVGEEGDSNTSAVTLSVSIAHLPETSLELAEFDRKDLRRYHRGVELENPFTSLGGEGAPSFLMFGVNDQSAAQLLPAIEEWYPRAAVVGGVSPLIDRCVPLATYCGGLDSRQDRKQRKNRSAQQQAYRRPRPRGKVAFPSTMLLRLHGKVGVRAFSSSGYHPITPVLRCESTNVAEELTQVVAYDLVSLVGHETSEEFAQLRIIDLLDPSERLAIEQEGRALNIFACHESAPLEYLLNNCYGATEMRLSEPDSVRIDRLEFVFWLQNGLVSLPGLCWQERAYGILASHHHTRTSQALKTILRSIREGLANDTALGAFLVAGALNEVEDQVHAKDVREHFTGVFQELDIGGCIVSTSIGPVAFPGGLQLPARRRALVQAHTTCGAIFYTKA